LLLYSPLPSIQIRPSDIQNNQNNFNDTHFPIHFTNNDIRYSNSDIQNALSNTDSTDSPSNDIPSQSGFFKLNIPGFNIIVIPDSVNLTNLMQNLI